MTTGDKPRVPVLRRKLFTEAMRDEVMLCEQAQRIIEQRGLVLNKLSVLALSKEKGADLAASCYYQSLLRSEHGKLIAMIDAYDITSELSTTCKLAGDINIVVVPGMFYKEYPDVGADGCLALSIANRLGFKVQQVAVQSRGSISANANLLAETLESLDSTNIWLVSLSKGSSEVLAYLNSNRVHSGLRGWINIAGVSQGTPHATRKISSYPRRLAYFVLSQMVGVEYLLLHELDPGHSLWNVNFDPSALQCIHVVPIPLRSHVQGILKKRYEKLLGYGPNDGIVPIVDAQQLPGSIYPVWGVDHFMRTPKVSELLYKFFIHVAYSK